MTQYEYLYNTTKEEMQEFNKLLYTEALNLKVQKAKQLLVTLYEPHYLDRDTTRINSVVKAIKFNIKLLDELRY